MPIAHGILHAAWDSDLNSENIATRTSLITSTGVINSSSAGAINSSSSAVIAADKAGDTCLGRRPRQLAGTPPLRRSALQRRSLRSARGHRRRPVTCA